MPAVCKFFLKGYCRYGRNCRFEHPGENDYVKDYTNNYNNQQKSVTNFSFRTGPSNDNYSNFGNSQFNSFNTTNEFSFRQPVQSNPQQNNIFNPDDVDMSEGFSFRQSELGNIFGQNTQSTLQQNNNNINNLVNNNIFGSANLYHQQSFQFNQPYSNNFNQQRSPFEQVQQQNTTFNNNNNNNSSSFINNNNTTNAIITEPNKKSEFRELNELTQAELDAFRKEKFEFCRIPVRPPAKTLC